MDKDKLTKAASDASDNAVFDSNNWNNFNEGFIKGAEWLMTQPLAERLTDEEKESIMFAYETSARFVKATENTNPHVAEVFRGQYTLLISIFGKGMFKEK